MFNKETQDQLEKVKTAWQATFKGGFVWDYKTYLDELVILKYLLTKEDPQEVEELMDTTLTERATITWREHLNKA